MILFVRQPAFNQTLISSPVLLSPSFFLTVLCNGGYFSGYPSSSWPPLLLSVIHCFSSEQRLALKGSLLSPLSTFSPPNSHHLSLQDIFSHSLPSIKPQFDVALNTLLSKVTYRLELALFLSLIFFNYQNLSKINNLSQHHCLILTHSKSIQSVPNSICQHSNTT